MLIVNMIIERKIRKNIIFFILILITYRDIFQITNSQLWYFLLTIIEWLYRQKDFQKNIYSIHFRYFFVKEQITLKWNTSLICDRQHDLQIRSFLRMIQKSPISSWWEDTQYLIDNCTAVHKHLVLVLSNTVVFQSFNFLCIVQLGEVSK